MAVKFLIAIVFLFLMDGHAAIYKCVDPKRHVTYGDTQCMDGVSQEVINAESSNDKTLDESFFHRLYEKLKHFFKNESNASSSVIKHETINMNESNKYQCDGRSYCSQMSSCEEATYFINHCPDTKMDGNHDGIPCERQWCR